MLTTRGAATLVIGGCEFRWISYIGSRFRARSGFLFGGLGLQGLGIFIAYGQVFLELFRILQKRIRDGYIFRHDRAVSLKQSGLVFLQKSFPRTLGEPNGQARLMQ